MSGEKRESGVQSLGDVDSRMRSLRGTAGGQDSGLSQDAGRGSIADIGVYRCGDDADGEEREENEELHGVVG